MVLDWLKEMSNSGLLCSAYTDKLLSSLSKKELVDFGLDANGVHWWCEIRMKGVKFDYSMLTREFGRFINGRYIFTSKPNKKGYSYTSSLYCCYDEDIIVNTTVTSILNCKATIHVSDNDFVSLHIDENCDVEIVVPESSNCRVYIYGTPKVRTTGAGNVKLINVG